jgi:hypothetical protein
MNFYVGTATGGLIVLGQRAPPYKTRLFNPLKGFNVQIPAEELSSVVVMMKPSLTIFISDLQNNTIRWADKSSKAGGSTLEFGHGFYMAPVWADKSRPFAVLQCMTHFAGDVFAIDRYGSIMAIMHDTANPGTKLEMNTAIVGTVPDDEYFPDIFYLVEYEGELLFVTSERVYNGQSAIYRVDTKNRVLKPVISIGSQALFLGRNRCISIDSSKVPTV